MTSRTSPLANSRESVLEAWIRELNFYETEIKCCELSLEEAVQRPLPRTALIDLEHFQNQFIHQRTVINDMKYKVRHVPEQPAAIEWTERELHSFRKNFNNLLREFDTYVQQWLD